MADKAKAAAGNADNRGENNPKSVQPKDEVGARNGCRPYRWQLKDNNKEFWLTGHGGVKVLTLGCLIATLILFNTVRVHPMVTLILSMEVSILMFFIFIYTTAFNRYTPFIVWPISDLLNDLFTCIFLIGGIVIAVKRRRFMPFNYFIAVVLMGVAAFFTFIDLCLQREHLKDKKARNGTLVPPNNDGKLPQPGTMPPPSAAAAAEAPTAPAEVGKTPH
uniref:CKLF-like MARVEL transmembrane domain-containing protein 2 n=1 Tax=Jaculus jaculus TaxID=51337 RepID=UPI0003333BCF|nr:CKLF-like MARVEL transmembrane domain-containing protein 2 [Jaculus jaculus]